MLNPPRGLSFFGSADKPAVHPKKFFATPVEFSWWLALVKALPEPNAEFLVIAHQGVCFCGGFVSSLVTPQVKQALSKARDRFQRI